MATIYLDRISEYMFTNKTFVSLIDRIDVFNIIAIIWRVNLKEQTTYDKSHFLFYKHTAMIKQTI
jgi:hypothetical protein